MGLFDDIGDFVSDVADVVVDVGEGQVDPAVPHREPEALERAGGVPARISPP